ncbi:DUF2914 domain-containing protein [Hyalangium gracile]|uniref:DUF2914 domain-containing protein n=1 Tax=Hyalangium gracile TaxID=394092 RepID=UPI001CCC1D3B|nr:DUF2914 domain-containing protein [Hyalangium gracile]
MATATPPVPGEPTGTPEPTPAAAPSNSLSNTLTAESALTPAAPALEARPADPDDAVPTAKTGTLMERVQEWRKKNELLEMAAFFFIGFIYDVVTLSRIDDTLTMVQQFVYLGVLATLLVLEQRHPEGTEPPKALAKVWKWREDAIHFFFGSLLSSYTLFFFKSASGLTAFLFLVLMFGLMVANELPHFRQIGPVVRVALFSLCVSMYFSYVLPVVIGKANFWVFLLAQVLAGGAIFGVMKLLRRWNVLDQLQAIRQIALPGFGVLVALLLFFVVRVLPPVPLAVTFSGIYHAVEKKGGAYHLSHQPKWWKFWHKGDQDFAARPGDKAYYFFSIFAPKGFDSYSVNVRWYHDHPSKGWTNVSTVPLKILNKGIERGYRTFAYTSNPKPGDWRVVVETEDGHEISRLSFSVEEDTSAEPRQFEVFVHDPDKKPEPVAQKK